jgi:AraC-like DNA-binding protein
MQWDDFGPSINYLVARRCTPEWRLGPHKVSEYDITYVTKGGAEYTIDGKIYTLGPGDVLYLSPGTVKEARTWSNRLMHCFSVNYSPLWGSGVPVFPEKSSIGIRRDLITWFNDMTFAWLEGREGYRVKTRGLLLLILHRLWELTCEPDLAGGDYRVKKICRYIADHYPEKLSVKKLAARANLNPVYFGALFKRETGLPVQKYIAQSRIRQAESLLQTGEYQVQEIAKLCGYRDVFHFYKQFKGITGFPPSRYIPKDESES